MLWRGHCCKQVALSASIRCKMFLLLNDPQIEKIDYWCQKSATLWVCPLLKKTGQPVAQHRQRSFCYFTSLASKKNHMSRHVTKPTKWHVRPAKTLNSLGIRPVLSESSLSTVRKLGSLATHWVLSEDSDQTGRVPRLIWVFAGRTVILMVLSQGGSY